jgi:hypothetical protein
MRHKFVQMWSVYTFPDGLRVSGTFVDGLLQGPARELYPCDLLVQREWRDGSPAKCGSGTLTYPDGTTYQGALVDGQPQGEGQLCTAAGVVCSGQFVAGAAHGMAVQRMPNGEVFVGGFRGGRRDGAGTFTFLSGEQMKGVWVDGVFHHAVDSI